MWNKQRFTFIVLGVLFHIFYLWSIFDIYFVSPLIHGMKHHRSVSGEPPAQRLFLIVGDGLRADTAFDNISHPTTGETAFLAPFLRSLVQNNGTYGISHTRMPTESRPGHVAMIAGFYEDVSAVTKGWKENPVDFDSVFNQSTHTYSFGSPDILPMFKEGASDKNKIDTWMYGSEYEDFTQSSIELDAFVFDHLDELFLNATKDATLKSELMRQGNVFFLHLLGCDTAGHAYRPYSAEYYDNVKYIDGKISTLVDQVRDFFGDDETAFVFTADHGMHASGLHGDGHPDNTRTPLIAWGAGVNKPLKNRTPIFDSYTKGWDLADIRRNDVKQADIASLMSYLVGINYPANSVGELPLAFIDGSETDKLKALYNNALSLLEQYLVKEMEMKESQFHYKQYHKFEKMPHSKYLTQIEELITKIDMGETYLEREAITLTEELMKTILEGLNYLTTYNWRFIRAIVSLGFVGWTLYSFILFLRLFILTTDYETKASPLNVSAFTIISMVLNYILYYQRSPFNFYMYLLFPLIFWCQIFASGRVLVDGLKEVFKGLGFAKQAGFFFLLVAVYEGIVYGFFHRWIFTVMFNALAFYPYLCGVKSFRRNAIWFMTSAAISAFTLFDAVKIENLTQINISSFLIIAGGAYALKHVRNRVNTFTLRVLICQIILVILMVLTTNKSVISLQQRAGLPKDAQIAGWVLIVLSLIVAPTCHYHKPNDDYLVRMLSIFLTLAPTFVILTISFESFFYFLFSIYILQWIEIESSLKLLADKSGSQRNWLQVLRISLIGIFLLQIAFFGTGNVASISSFSLESVFRLLPIFSPFAMGFLLTIKLIVPYITLSTGLGIITRKLNIKDYTISSLIISTSDILSLNFFYLLRTDGSWLDIGITITNYCLAILSSLFMLILELISHILLRGVAVNPVVSTEKKGK